MGDNTTNSNFEWKKKHFDKNERLSKGIDVRQASLADKQKKDQITSVLPITASASDPHLKKMRKKIRQAVDEEDDDDEEDFFDNSLTDWTFLNQTDEIEPFAQKNNDQALRDKELKRTLKNVEMQHNNAKLQALTKVNRLAAKSGLSPLSTQDFAANMQNNGWENETFKMAVEHHIAPDLKNNSR